MVDKGNESAYLLISYIEIHNYNFPYLLVPIEVTVREKLKEIQWNIFGSKN